MFTLTSLLCITPNPAIDRTITVPGFRIGQIHRSAAARVAAGGKGLNVARASRTLGSRACCIAPCGGPAGQLLADLASHEGLDTYWTAIAGETRTCTIIADPETGISTVLNEQGPQLSEPEWQQFMADVATQAQQSAVTCLCGSLPLGVRPDQLANLISSLRQQQRPIWVDSSGPALVAAVHARPTGIKVNADELAVLCDQPLTTLPLVWHHTARIARQHQLTVVVTLGANGAIACDQEEQWWVRSPSITVNNPIGSGDSFYAALLVGLTQGLPLAEALRHGVAAGSANAAAGGGGSFSRELFEQLLHQTDPAVQQPH